MRYESVKIDWKPLRGGWRSDFFIDKIHARREEKHADDGTFPYRDGSFRRESDQQSGCDQQHIDYLAHFPEVEAESVTEGHTSAL